MNPKRSFQKWQEDSQNGDSDLEVEEDGFEEEVLDRLTALEGVIKGLRSLLEELLERCQKSSGSETNMVQ